MSHDTSPAQTWQCLSCSSSHAMRRKVATYSFAVLSSARGISARCFPLETSKFGNICFSQWGGSHNHKESCCPLDLGEQNLLLCVKYTDHVLHHCKSSSSGGDITLSSALTGLQFTTRTSRSISSGFG